LYDFAVLGVCFGHIDQVPPALSAYADDCKQRYAHHFICAE
jgi:hypothetical protein